MQGRWLVVVVAALAVASCGAVGPRGPMRHFRRAVDLRRRQLAPATAGGRSLPGSMSLIETIMRAGVTMADAAHLPTAYNVAEVMNNASNYVEHVVVEGEDIDTLAHNFYFGDHWKAMDLLMFNIQLTRAKAGAHDFAVGDKVVIPKPSEYWGCTGGWRWACERRRVCGGVRERQVLAGPCGWACERARAACWAGGERGGSCDVGRRRQVQAAGVVAVHVCVRGTRTRARTAVLGRRRLRGRAAGSAAWCSIAVVCVGDGVCVASPAGVGAIVPPVPPVPTL